MTVPAVSAHTDALVAALGALGHVRAGDGARPDGGGWQGAPGASDFVGYVVVYQLNPGFDGPLADKHADLTGRWQVTAVGATRPQAGAVADAVRTWLLSSARTQLTVAGRAVAAVWHDGGGDTYREDGTGPALYYVPDRYVILTTPTP
jgi:hypothetical protein